MLGLFQLLLPSGSPVPSLLPAESSPGVLSGLASPRQVKTNAKQDIHNHCLVSVLGECVFANMCVTGTNTANGNRGSRRNEKLEKTEISSGPLLSASISKEVKLVCLFVFKIYLVIYF